MPTASFSSCCLFISEGAVFMSCIRPAGARELCLSSMVIHCVRGGNKTTATVAEIVCLLNCAVFVSLVCYVDGSNYFISYKRTALEKIILCTTKEKKESRGNHLEQQVDVRQVWLFPNATFFFFGVICTELILIWQQATKHTS